MKISYEHKEIYADFMLQILCSESGEMWQGKIYHSYDFGVSWRLTLSTHWSSDFHGVLKRGRELLFERFKDTVHWDDDYGAASVKKRWERDCERWE